jgi:entericidin B
MTRKILAVLMMLGFLGAFGTMTGCNTVAGAGKDVERGGQAIHDTAKDAQQKM